MFIRVRRVVEGPISIITTGWWFGACFIFPYIGNNHPNWLIFFRGETTNQGRLMELRFLCSRRWRRRAPTKSLPSSSALPESFADAAASNKHVLAPFYLGSLCIHVIYIYIYLCIYIYVLSLGKCFHSSEAVQFHCITGLHASLLISAYVTLRKEKEIQAYTRNLEVNCS